MGFFDLFNMTEKSKPILSGLHQKISARLPETSNENLSLITCMAGLLARVAYVDFELHKNELKEMHESLKEWVKLDDHEIEAITDLAIHEVKDLAGLENHLYCHPVNDILDNDQKYNILITLFKLAAADGNVEHRESEEIRLICQGLRLEHKHFVSARASVIKHLGSLKKED